MKKRTVAKIIFPLIRLWTVTWRFVGKLPTDDGCIMLTWHEELFPVLKAGSHQDWIVIISASKDGDMLERLILPWGYRTIRGSASKHDKAVAVLRDTIKLVKHNKLTIGSDGPRGPRRKIKIGMLLAAQISGKPIYLVRIRGKGIRLEKAWDKLLIPYPFAKIQVLTEGPIHFPKDIDRDQLMALSEELNTRLNNLGDDESTPTT